MILTRRAAGAPSDPAPEWFNGSDRDFWLLKTLIADESQERLALALSLASFALASAVALCDGQLSLLALFLFLGVFFMIFASDGFTLFPHRRHFFDRLCAANLSCESSERIESKLERLCFNRLKKERSSWMRSR